MTTILGLLFFAALVGIVRPYINGWTRWYFAGAALACTVLAAIISPATPDATASSAAPAATEPTSAPAETKKSETTEPTTMPQPAASNWSYSTSSDEMRGQTSTFAKVESENEVEFDFPYHGGSTATLTIRKRPTDGTNVFLAVSSGQFLCNSFNDTTLSVKFDQGPIRKFSCTDTSDGSSDVIFINNETSFIKSLKASKKVIIEAEFFQAGNRQFTFETAGLEWK